MSYGLPLMKPKPSRGRPIFHIWSFQLLGWKRRRLSLIGIGTKVSSDEPTLVLQSLLDHEVKSLC